MNVTYSLFGELEYDDYESYITNTSVMLSGRESEIELVISETFGDGGIERGHCEAYEALMAGIP